jgi:ABC-2 type transport system permease protein
MSNVWWILRRDLGAYLRSPLGYVILAAVLTLDGLLFNAFAVGTGKAYSEDVLGNFFFLCSGVHAAAAIFIAMRLIAEERQLGTLTLLSTSTVRDHQLVLGKFLSALCFVTLMTALTFYMPMLVVLNGKVSMAHLCAGYLGLILITSATIALGMFASALAPNQLLALVLGALLVGVFWLFWLLSKIASPPVEELLAYLSLHDRHFRPFMRGLISTQDVLFYVTLIYVALVATTRVLEARRWR